MSGIDNWRGDNTGAVRADIEATRERMGDTLEELGTRLNPERLKAQAKNAIREATIGRVETMAQTTIDKATTAGRKVTDVIRENPIPVALIVAGAGWLAWSLGRGGSSSTPSLPSHDGNRPHDGDETGEAVDPGIREAGGGGGIADAVRGKASAVADAAQSATHRVAESASHAATTVAGAAREQTAKVARSFESNPIVLGAVALAVGLAAGFAVHSTQKEGELFGAQRDDLMDKARDLIAEKKEQVQHVAERVVSEVESVATTAAREEGLTG